jgi:hypothetical protein
MHRPITIAYKAYRHMRAGSGSVCTVIITDRTKAQRYHPGNLSELPENGLMAG